MNYIFSITVIILFILSWHETIVHLRPDEVSCFYVESSLPQMIYLLQLDLLCSGAFSLYIQTKLPAQRQHGERLFRSINTIINCSPLETAYSSNATQCIRFECTLFLYFFTPDAVFALILSYNMAEQ